jgi:hydroxymethylpyrimidine pyrophosphatase-like HAD family hydrolase
MRFAVGVDLHGTLMEDGEYIRPELLGGLIAALKSARRVCRLYVCTGNDLSFVKRKIPPDVLGLFDGMVLETGCVLSGGDDERVLVDSGVIGRVKELETRLRGYCDPEAYKFDRRLASIAIFTKYGHQPAEYWRKVEERVKGLGYWDAVYTTHSSVAVDVVPKGFSKYTGLKAFAGGLETAGVADSMNDLQLHLQSDYSFAPSNIGAELRGKLIESGREIARLSDAGEIERGVTYVADGHATEGVIQILERLASLTLE